MRGKPDQRVLIVERPELPKRRVVDANVVVADQATPEPLPGPDRSEGVGGRHLPNVCHGLTVDVLRVAAQPLGELRDRGAEALVAGRP